MATTKRRETAKAGAEPVWLFAEVVEVEGEGVPEEAEVVEGEEVVEAAVEEEEEVVEVEGSGL